MAKVRGKAKPRLETPRIKGKSKGKEFAEWVERYADPLMPWQKHVSERMMVVDRKGDYKITTQGLLIARQQGKTHLARMRILYELFAEPRKSRVIGLSSNRNMAIDTFRQVIDVIESNDELKSLVKQIRYANGQESVTLLDGSMYEIAAATRDGVRGKTAHLVFVDELREISREAWAAIRPTTTATNGVLLTASNAGDAFSEVLNSLRETALSYPPKSLGWWEYSAEPFCKLQDVDQILQANPAIGYTTKLETIQEYIKTAKPEDARTEHLCLWVDAISSPWPYRAFEDLTVQDLQLSPGATTIFAIDTAITKKKASLVAAQLMPDGKIGVGIMQQWESEVAIDELKVAVDIKTWWDRYRPTMLCYDKYATASIADRLQKSGCKVVDMSGQIFYTACGDLLEAIVNNRITHNGQAELVSSMNNCGAKVNDAGWRIIRRKSAGDVSAAIALAMVVHQLMKPQSKPAIFA
ncbi:MAG: terminase large subunit domain-containing protein [Candidatus Nanopelagicaceae bacterium]